MMGPNEPTAVLDPGFSDPNATATPWPVPTVAAVWIDDGIHFTTGPTERKAKNLAENRHCAITKGTNTFQFWSP
jgi:hypothetical protein